jgi:hypothetical protein
MTPGQNVFRESEVSWCAGAHARLATVFEDLQNMSTDTRPTGQNPPCRPAFINIADVLPALTAYPELTLCLSPDGGSLWKSAEGITDP